MKSRQNVIIDVDYSNINDLRSEIDGKFHYFYKIINPVNKKYYYGIHSTNNIFDGYAGSGSILKSVYKKYGKNNCIKYIEKFFDDRKSLLNYEKYIINENLIADPNCYNILTGGGGCKICGKVPTIAGEHVDSDEFKILSNHIHPTYGRIHINNGIKNKLVYPSQLDDFLSKGWIIGETHKSTKGKIVINLNNIEERFIYPEELDQYINNGWTRGGKSRNLGLKSFAKNQIWISKENRQIRINNDDLDIYLNDGWIRGTCQSTTKGYIRITNGSEDKNINPNNIEELNFYLFNGWIIGSCSKTTKGKIWINNEIESKLIEKKDFESYLKNGWIKGRKKSSFS